MFRVAQVEIRLQPEDVEALPAELEAFHREVHHRDVGAGPGEVDRVRTDPAADLEHLLAAPALEFGELGDVWFDEVLAGFDLVEVLARSDRVGRVADVAGPPVPVGADLVDDRRAVSRARHAGQVRARAGSVHMPPSFLDRLWMSSPT